MNYKKKDGIVMRECHECHNPVPTVQLKTKSSESIIVTWCMWCMKCNVISSNEMSPKKVEQVIKKIMKQYGEN